jgi:hypothetical protein
LATAASIGFALHFFCFLYNKYHIMNTRNLSIFAAFLLPLTFLSQQGFTPGYIIGMAGDTVRGEVKVNEKKPQEHYEKVMFRDDKGMQKTYKPNKIKGYGYKDQHFVSIIGADYDSFYRILAQGPLSLYELMYELERVNKKTIEKEYYLAAPGAKHYDAVKERGFKKQLASATSDNPSIAENYPDEKQFDPEAATAAIKEYNAWKATQN